MKATKCLWGLILGLVLACGTGQAADNELKATLFDATDNLLEEGKSKQINLLAPQNYEKAIEHYNRATQAFKQGKSLEDIRKDLREANKRLQAALETSQLSTITFAAVLDARTQAQNANAGTLSKDLWREAEEDFNDAAEEFEDGDVKQAQKEAKLVAQQYRKAEVDAHKAHYLTEARNLLQHAKEIDAEEYAQTTLQKARRSVQVIEKMLEQPSFDAEEVTRLSKEAEQTAQHAVQLTLEIRDLNNKQNLESVILQWENQLAKLAETAQIESTPPINREELVASLLEKLRTYQNQIRKLDDELAQSDTRLQDLQSNLGELEQKVEKQSDARERIDKISELLNKDEANIQHSGDDIVIRLYGLQFSSGKSEIQSEYFYILGKIQQIIHLFPEAAITIEGHTDSYGNETLNRNLSEKRAQAVRDYILANTDISGARLVARGIGEDNPIATNDTAEGRAKNRRIDIILHLNSAHPPLGAFF